MDRFEYGLPDPQEAEVIDHCSVCGGEMYAGQMVFEIGCEKVCDLNCLAAFVNAEVFVL